MIKIEINGIDLDLEKQNITFVYDFFNLDLIEKKRVSHSKKITIIRTDKNEKALNLLNDKLLNDITFNTYECVVYFDSEILHYNAQLKILSFTEKKIDAILIIEEGLIFSKLENLHLSDLGLKLDYMPNFNTEDNNFFKYLMFFNNTELGVDYEDNGTPTTFEVINPNRIIPFFYYFNLIKKTLTHIGYSYDFSDIVHINLINNLLISNSNLYNNIKPEKLPVDENNYIHIQGTKTTTYPINVYVNKDIWRDTDALNHEVIGDNFTRTPLQIISNTYQIVKISLTATLISEHYFDLVDSTTTVDITDDFDLYKNGVKIDNFDIEFLILKPNDILEINNHGVPNATLAGGGELTLIYTLDYKIERVNTNINFDLLYKDNLKKFFTNFLNMFNLSFHVYKRKITFFENNGIGLSKDYSNEFANTNTIRINETSKKFNLQYKKLNENNNDNYNFTLLNPNTHASKESINVLQSEFNSPETDYNLLLSAYPNYQNTNEDEYTRMLDTTPLKLTSNFITSEQDTNFNKDKLLIWELDHNVDIQKYIDKNFIDVTTDTTSGDFPKIKLYIPSFDNLKMENIYNIYFKKYIEYFLVKPMIYEVVFKISQREIALIIPNTKVYIDYFACYFVIKKIVTLPDDFAKVTLIKIND